MYVLFYVIDFCFFFFQAEDGIRDLTVTGVQTCALPISLLRGSRRLPSDRAQGPTRRRARALRAARVGRGGVRGARRSAGRRACRGPERIHEAQGGAGALTPGSRGAQRAL